MAAGDDGGDGARAYRDFGEDVALQGQGVQQRGALRGPNIRCVKSWRITSGSTAVRAGGAFSLALTRAGHLLAWEFNGDAHSLALTSNNGVLTWGRNTEGELGDKHDAGSPHSSRSGQGAPGRPAGVLPNMTSVCQCVKPSDSYSLIAGALSSST